MSLEDLVERNPQKAVGMKSYLIPVTATDTAPLRLARPSPVTDGLCDFLERYGYGQIITPGICDRSVPLLNAVRHPSVVLRILQDRKFRKSTDMLPFFEWDEGRWLGLALAGSEEGSVRFLEQDRDRVSSSLMLFMERLAVDPRFYLERR